MQTMNRLTSLTETSIISYLRLLVFLALFLLQAPIFSLQFESVAMRNMTSFKKFEGLSQNAVVIKSRENSIKYLDSFEFSGGQLTNAETSNRLFYI